MLPKTFRRLNDGCDSVVIELVLPRDRLQCLQKRAFRWNRSVDAVIGDAIAEYLLRVSQNGHGVISIKALYQQIAELECENTALKTTLVAHQKRIKRYESSPLQMYLPFMVKDEPDVLE